MTNIDHRDVKEQQQTTSVIFFSIIYFNLIYLNVSII